jgi:hypothetical protein
MCACEDDAHLSLARIERGFEASEKQYGVSILNLNRIAFLTACPNDCVSVFGDRQPRSALLSLEHLHKKTRGKMQSSIDETTKSILDQARAAETANAQ